MSTAATEIIVKLRADAGVTAILSTLYQSVVPIFRTRAPEDAALPYAVVRGPISQVPDDTQQTNAREELYDVGCYVARTGGAATAADALGEAVWAALHAQTLASLGAPPDFVYLLATGPIAVDEEDSLGRIVSARVGMTF